MRPPRCATSESAYADLAETERDLLSGIFYEDCCAYALEGDSQKALEALREAFTAGYSDFDHAEADPDLKSLRALPEFTSLISQEYPRLIEREKATFRTQLDQQPKFAFDFKLPGMDGEKFSLSKLRGKVVVVDVWGTWCPGCRREIPNLVRLKNDYRNRGFEIVGLNFENVPHRKRKKKSVTIARRKGQLSVRHRRRARNDFRPDPQFPSLPDDPFLDRNGGVRLQA